MLDKILDSFKTKLNFSPWLGRAINKLYRNPFDSQTYG